MLSFELNDGLDALKFQKELQLIKPAMSLAGVESTMVSPYLTSHASLTQDEREALGIRNGLIRFSVGIESKQDLIDDIEQAVAKVKHEHLMTK
jgi:cystathionine beta-lyase